MSRTSAESRHVDDPNPRTEAPSSHASGPAVHHLGITQCRALLARNRTGRIAFALDNRVDIEPIHFVYHDGWIFGRTSPGTKAAALRHNPWVAFEVDEAEGVFDWRSVVAHGTLYFLDEDGPVTTIELRDRAVKLLQRLVPDLGTPFDPVAHRSLVFGIHVSTYTGRASRIDG